MQRHYNSIIITDFDESKQGMNNHFKLGITGLLEFFSEGREFRESGGQIFLTEAEPLAACQGYCILSVKLT